MRKAKAPERRMIEEEIGYISVDDLEGSFEEVIMRLREAEATHKEHAIRSKKWVEGVSSLRLSHGANRYDDIYEFIIYVNRPETDKEYKIRCNRLTKEKEASEKKERAIYEALAKKYGKVK